MTKRRSDWYCGAALAAMLIAVVGCQPNNPPPAAEAGQVLPEYHPGGLEQALDDPCSAHMQDIEGAFLSYLNNNRNQLPDTLEQLKEVPGLGPGLVLTCPITGEAYKYSPQGLYLPPESKEARRIILWEPTASHHGSRACLLMPRLDPGRAASMEVKLIPEDEFKKAVPPIQ